MAFNSLFGAKPAGQTGSSLFGQSTTQPQGSSLFGSTQQQPQQQAGTSTFGGFGQTQNATQGSSLFGSTLGQNNQQQQPQQGSSLFGSTLGQNNQQQQGSSLFGSTLGQNTQQQQQQQPQQGSSLFGNPFGQPQQQQQQQQGQQSGTGLFGQPAGQQQQQQKPMFGASTGSLFGSNTQNQQGQQQQQGAFGGFGSNASSLQPQATHPSLFGNSTMGTQQVGSSLWGRPPAQQHQQPQAPMFTKSTKFNDLPDEAKRVFENIDSAIQSKVQICNDLKQRKLGDEALKGQEEIRNVHKELTAAISLLTSDMQHTKDLKHKVEQTVQDTIVATRIVEGFRNPQQHGQYLKTYANFPLEFFHRVTEEMKERLRWYKTTIEVRALNGRNRGMASELMLGVCSTSSASSPLQPPSLNTPLKVPSRSPPPPQALMFPPPLSSPSQRADAQPSQSPAIVSTLEAQHATFMALAAKAAALDAELQKLRTLYTQLWRAKTGSMRDPFNELDRGSDVGELGLESLSAK
ncbi:hypothetical protein BN946_scf184754.g1 [Trametes cinnabarina]|uniref:Nucleoporin Nup54 alpha-helical domain-containing protein n=1 Tax=Pycnoporus cinnabarinus TaxID=5643 RepID=A0A060S268_PYCCI|nr:hypothetical protein BN946_scf184754.g1 [Trametes cinnabarina]